MSLMAHIMEHQGAQLRTLLIRPGKLSLPPPSLVSTHISNMSSSSSPGFDTVLPSVIKHACKLVPRHHGRGLENCNVLAP
eukprot:1138817-Pelagomonas_calceolata.AAC.1